MMRRFARWHIWLGWLAGVPILLWMVTGLFMASKPIEEVRGNHLRIDQPAEPLVLPGSALASAEFPLREMRVVMQQGRALAILTALDGRMRRVDMETGLVLPPLTAEDARNIVAQGIRGGDNVRRVTAFEATEVPFDFRREMPVWQVVLDNGTHVYVGQESGRIEAVRTRWWRVFDFMWGLHIMDLQTREDTSHPVLILFAVLGTLAAMLGCVLMFRRRKARAPAR